MVGRESAWKTVMVSRENVLGRIGTQKGGWLWAWAGQVRAGVWEVPPFSCAPIAAGVILRSPFCSSVHRVFAHVVPLSRMPFTYFFTNLVPLQTSHADL